MTSQGDDPISRIITKVVEIEKALTPPTEAAKAPLVYDEMPVSPNAFPCFINAPRRGRKVTATAATRERTEFVDVMMLFGRADEFYSVRAQRLWVPVVLDGFDQHFKLVDNRVQHAEITDWNYDPVEINEVPYIAVTFTLECHIAGTFTFGS